MCRAVVTVGAVVGLVVGGACLPASAADVASTTVASLPAADAANAALGGQTGRDVPAGFVPVSVTFVSDRDGWVLGSAPCGKRRCTTVLRTTDGAKSWRKVGAPAASLESATQQPGSVSQIRFADLRDGYADGVGLWATHDGGVRWTRNYAPAGVEHAVITDLVVSGHTVYALVSGTERHYGGSDSHIRLVSATVSSGKFRVVRDLGTDHEASGFTSSDGEVYFVSGRIARRSDLVRVHGRAVTSTRLPNASCGDPAASTATSLLLLCGNAVASGSMGDRMLYASSNSGHTFRRLPGPGRGAGYDDAGIAAAGDGHAVVATVGIESGELRSTGDGARTWHTSLELSDARFSDLGFEDAEHGVVIATIESVHDNTAQLYRTTTGGRTWTRVAFR